MCESLACETTYYAHTILLGPYKYIPPKNNYADSAAEARGPCHNEHLRNYSGFNGKGLGNVIHHHKSFVGRDYKALVQMTTILSTFQIPQSRCCWLYHRYNACVIYYNVNLVLNLC